MLPTYSQLRIGLKFPPLPSAALAFWILAVGVGWAAMTSYEFQTFDDASNSAAQWPEALAERSSDRPTLVVCLHPKCPCSQATLSELERLLARTAAVATQPKVLAVIAMPTDADDSWTSSPLVQRCRRLPEARVAFDRGGRIAAAFGASTSGEVLLFDSAGIRQFAGGVTASRGHEGASAGSDAIVALLEGEQPTMLSTPVFGCRLVAPAAGEPQQCNPTSAPNSNPGLGVAPRQVEATTSIRESAHIPDASSI
jgi:hypothetical protein